MMIASDANSPAGTGEAPALAASTLRPRVFIVSEVRLLCDGLAVSLSQQPSVIVVGAADLTLSPARIAAARPDVALLDIGTLGGLDIAATFREILPDLKVIAIAVADIEQDVLACAEAGVSGFVSRNGSIHDVVTAVLLSCSAGSPPQAPNASSTATMMR